MTESIKGYKVFLPDYTSMHDSFVWSVGCERQLEGEPKLCENGFHFCEKVSQCFDFYDFDTNNIVCEITALGDIVKGDDKCVTDHIRIDRILSWQEVLDMVNTGKKNTGYGNSGDCNTGDYNSGDYNSGHSNTGYYNSGHRNSGHRNSGHYNSGDYNSGDCNTGDYNSGDYNSGYCNTGHYNSGDYNSGNRNSGAFCENTPTMMLFDKPSNMSFEKFEDSKVYRCIMEIQPTTWVVSEYMSEEERNAHPEHKTTGGCLRNIGLQEAWRRWWSTASQLDKKLFYALPNFDKEKFSRITGIPEAEVKQ